MASLKVDLGGFAQEWTERNSTANIQTRLNAGAFIYGAGGYGRRIFAGLMQRGHRCMGFIDRRANDTSFAESLSCPVLHPDEFQTSRSSGHALIAGVMNGVDGFSVASEWAAAHDFTAVLFPGQLVDYLHPAIDNYWLTKRSHTWDNIDQIEKLDDLLTDQFSHDILMQLLRYRLSGDVRYHPFVDRNLYLPDDVPIAKHDMVLIDGGAYIGDTFEKLTSLGAHIKEWYAFEPDIQNFTTLARVGLAASTKASFFPCGLAERTTDLFFTSGEGTGSHITAEQDGAKSVRVLALDDAVGGVKPTFVKLDIEGFEAEALDGMKTTLERANPALAICIYHKPADLWDLPLQMQRLLPNAKIYLRQHAENGLDTVAYAIP